MPSLPRQDPSLSQQPLAATPSSAAPASTVASQAASKPAEAASAPQDPRVACARRRSTFVPDALNLPYMDCLERSCKKAEFQAHAECAKIRELIEKRDGRIDR